MAEQPYSNAIAYGSSAPNPLLREFWSDQMREVEQVPSDPAEFKNHQLPLARIKKIMKSDEDVRMISAEAPVLFAKACEMFILELTLRAWQHAEENKRRTLQRNDVAAAITRTDIFDFLLDLVPREDLKLEDGASNALANTPASAAVPPPQGLAPSPTQASMPAPPTPPAPHMASAASMSMQQPPLGMSMYPAFPMYPGAPGGMGQGMDPSHMMMGMGPPFMGMPGQPWPGAMPGVMHGMPGMPGGMPGMPPGMHGMPPGMHGMHLMQGPMGGMHPGMHPGPGMQPGPHGGMQPGAQGMSGQHNAAKTSNPLSEGKSS
ncbi:histone-fold-containing protein [Haematococcus lacustris]